MKRPIVFTLMLLVLAGLLWVSRAQCAQTPVAAAAADLKFALTEAAQTFAAKTGKQVKLSFGSSGNFATQIINGAPFELFLSADEAYVKMLSQRGLTPDDGVLYAVGRIGLYVPKGSSVKADGELRGSSAAIAAGQVKRFAIANPEHAPYGRAARETLVKAALWDRLQGKLVLGENVGQAASITMLVNGLEDCRMAMSVPTHVARRNGLDAGVAIKVSLLSEAIHLMPWEDLWEWRDG